MLQIHAFVRQRKKNSVIADSSGLLKVERYRKEQRFFIVEECLKNNEGLAAFRTKYGRNVIQLHQL